MSIRCLETEIKYSMEVLLVSNFISFITIKVSLLIIMIAIICLKQNAYSVRHCVKCFTCILSFNLHMSLILNLSF